MRKILVFGSNTQGKHGKGQALEALKYFGAIYGQPKGLQGNSYAIVTKDLKRGLRSVSLASIFKQVQILNEFALANPKLEFHVCRLGCGLAGFTIEEIAPMFKNCPKNVKLNEYFKNFLNN